MTLKYFDGTISKSLREVQGYNFIYFCRKERHVRGLEKHIRHPAIAFGRVSVHFEASQLYRCGMVGQPAA